MKASAALAPTADGLASRQGYIRALVAYHAAAGAELPRCGEVSDPRYDATTAVVAMYLQSRYARFDTISAAELVDDYRLALDLHGIVTGTNVAWSRRWSLKLDLAGENLRAARAVARANRAEVGAVPADRAAALRVATALVGVLASYHDEDARLDRAPDFVSLLQAAALGVAKHEGLRIANLTDFDVLDLTVKTHRRYRARCWRDARPTLRLN